LREKLAAILIIPSSWGSQLDGEKPSTPCRISPLPDAALPPMYSPRWENLKNSINFPQNLLQAIAVIDTRSGGSRSSSQHPAREENHRWRPSSSPWLHLEWCVSSLP
jgi:hypothetical protein